MNVFATEHKSSRQYLDEAANSHGEEKGLLVGRALKRTPPARPHVVEIGPGGGSAVRYLASRLPKRGHGIAGVDLTLIEKPEVTSEALRHAMENFAEVGACQLLHGQAVDLNELLPRQADVVSASALMHEVYSYGGGYEGLHSLIRSLRASIRPYGSFVYRDPFAVQDRHLHERVTHVYDAPSWLRFIRMFTPGYLGHATHPYHRSQDQVTARQNSRTIKLSDLDVATCAVMEAPVGLFREIQRHYLTLRDHVWRSGVLGFRPTLKGPQNNEWLDAETGHKLIHYWQVDDDCLASRGKSILESTSSPHEGHFTADGDVFDVCTDISLSAFLAEAERGHSRCARIWSEWQAREGRETYTYLTTNELITEFALHSVKSCSSEPTVLIPERSEDIVTAPRRYYNRYLTRHLANPLWDAKQLVLFRNVPVSDSQMLDDALTRIRESFSKHNLARVHAALVPEREAHLWS